VKKSGQVEEGQEHLSVRQEASSSGHGG